VSDRVEMPVWGWGDPDQARSIPPGALAEISDRFDVSEPLQGHADASDFQIPQSRCSQALLDQLSRIVGADGVDVSVRSRVLRSLGKSYPDLCRGRSGRLDSAIDCVVRVASAEEVSGVLAAAAAHSAAVVPFGGGTSVVGGLDPIMGAVSPSISL
jgi:alkyldihydroxyacetonephosphate synthase